MDAARQLAQLAERLAQLLAGAVEQRGGGGGVVLELGAGQLHLQRERDEALLRAVVQVALQAAALGQAEGRDRSRATPAARRPGRAARPAGARSRAPARPPRRPARIELGVVGERRAVDDRGDRLAVAQDLGDAAIAGRDAAAALGVDPLVALPALEHEVEGGIAERLGHRVAQALAVGDLVDAIDERSDRVGARVAAAQHAAEIGVRHGEHQQGGQGADAALDRHGVRELVDGERDRQEGEEQRAGQQDRREALALEARGVQPAAHEQPAGDEDDHRAHQRGRWPRRIGRARRVEEGEDVVRRALGAGVVHAQQRHEQRADGRRPRRRGHDDPRERLADPARRIGEQQVDDHGEGDRADQVADREQQREVGAREPGQQPRETHGDHERTDAVGRTAAPGEQAGAEEAPADQQELDDDDDLVVGPVAAATRSATMTPRAIPRCRRPTGRGRGSSRSAASESPERSAFGMKPRAPLEATWEPKSEGSRLDVRITAGAGSASGSVSRLATRSRRCRGG